MIHKTRKSVRSNLIAHEVEQYAGTDAFVIKGKVIVPKAGKTGRPSVMIQEVVRKLEHAFVYDCTVAEACLYAGISRDTYYNFCKQNPDFSDRIEQLRHAPSLVLRKCVIAAAEHDANLALKYLERKNGQEFSSKQELVHSTDIMRHTIDPKQEALIKSVMGNFACKR